MISQSTWHLCSKPQEEEQQLFGAGDAEQKTQNTKRRHKGRDPRACMRRCVRSEEETAEETCRRGLCWQKVEVVHL